MENVTLDNVIVKAVYTIIRAAMGFVMIVTAIMLAVVFIATLWLQPKNKESLAQI